MKMAGKLVPEGVGGFETTSPGRILADPGKFATRGDFGKKPLQRACLGSKAP
jgi:hypothetical protein